MKMSALKLINTFLINALNNLVSCRILWRSVIRRSVIRRSVNGHFLTLLALTPLMILQTACDRKEAFNFLEGALGGDEECGISAQFPQSATVRSPGSPTGKTAINVSPSGSSCTIEYYLNGTKLSHLSGPTVDIPSSALSAGSNVLEARVSGEKLSKSLPTSATWTLVKNSPPVCGTQNPTMNGNQTGIGGRFDMSAPLTDSDGDALSASWYINGNPAGASITSEIASNVLVGYIVTTAEQAGALTLKAVVSDNLDSAECVWKLAVNEQCAFASFSPTPNPTTQEVRVPALGTAQTQFIAVPNAGSCNVTWTLNDSPIGGTGSVLPLLSSNLSTGTNRLRAVTTDGSTSAFKEWVIRKNSPPTCAFQNPNSVGTTYTLGGSNLLTALAADTENDSVTWTWTLNGSPAAPGVLNSVSSGNTSLTTFNLLPSAVSTGLNTVMATMNDGYDSGQCSWAIQVNTACTIVSTSPSGTTFKASASPTSSSTFSVTASDAGCPVNWSLNGAPLQGTVSTQVLQGSSLNPGGNTLVASVASGSKTWFISKNIPPQCGNQTPATSNFILGVGSATTFEITPNDIDDPVGPFTYGWKLNGLTIPPQITTSTSNSTKTGLANFTPISSQVGNTVLSVDVNDGYDATSCNWQSTVLPNCEVTTASPSSATSKVSSVASTSTTFVVGTNDPSCGVEWKLNGGNVISSAAAVNILSSQLNPGDNTLTARVYNSKSSSNRTWTVTKNTPPICANQSPSATGTIFGVADTLPMQATAGNTDGDSIAFAWTINGNTVPGAILSITSPSPLVSDGVFAPNNSYIGSNSIIASINDGYDSATCNWAVTVRPNCAILSSLPSSASARIADASGSSQTFGIVPNDSSCSVNWELNGTSVASSTQFLNVLSSSLNPGANTLTATVTNGTSTVTRTWTVTRNRPPLCAAQTPALGTTMTVDVGTSKDLSAVITDQDNDTYIISWLLNSLAAPSNYTNITSNSITNTYAARFTPGVSQVGQGQFVGVSANDGFDSTVCSWPVNINDPNTVQIQACLPTGNPVVLTSVGPASSKDFTVSATGTGLNYQWILNGSEMSGQTQPAINMTAAGLTVGNHSLVARVRDAYNNEVSCTFNVKRNSPPALTLPVPALSTLFRVNFAKTVPMGITATDGNNDALTYTWKMNGDLRGNYLPSGASATLFDPKSDVNVLGPHTLTVEVNDSHETTSYSWNIQVTTFTDACNNIMNGPVSGAGATGGQICTLVGYPGAGDDFNPITSDPSTIRIRPWNMLEDELGNLIFTDDMNHVIWYWNRQAYSVTKFNKVIAPGRMRAILGAGGAGNTNPTNTSAGGPSGFGYKLNNPYGLAYDPEDKVLYIGDTSNHRVLSLHESTNYPQLFLGGNGTTNTALTNTANALGRTHVCSNPYALAFRGTGANRRLYVGCYDQSNIKVVNADYDDSANYSRADIALGRTTASVTVNGLTLNDAASVPGIANGLMGRTGDAEVSGPLAMNFDPLGRLYIWEQYSNIRYPTSRGFNAFRVKVANFGTTALTAFSNGSTSHADQVHISDETPSIGAAIFGRGIALNTSLNQMQKAGAQAANATLLSVPVTATHNLMVSGPNRFRPNACIPFMITPRFNTLAGRLAAPVTVTLTAPFAGASLFSDASCSTPVSTLNLTTGTPFAVIYQRATGTGTGNLTAAAPGFTTGTLSVTAVTPGTNPNGYLVSYPSSYVYNTCIPIVIQPFNMAGGLWNTTPSNYTPQTVPNDRTLRLLADGAQSFYTDSACSTNPIYRVVMPAGAGELVLYTDRKVNIQPGHASVLLGSAYSDPWDGSGRHNFGSAGAFTNIPDGQAWNNWTTYGIEVDWNSTGNTLRGVFLSSYDHHRINYLNLSGSTLNLGPYTSVPILIENGDLVTLNNTGGACSYVIGGNGPSSRTCNQTNLKISNDRSKMYFADRSNGRISSGSLALFGSGGGSSTFANSPEVGSGYWRFLNGNYNDSSTPAVDVRLNRPFRSVIDPETKRLYFTDQAYCRVRYVDLLSGMVQTVVSRGCADQTGPDDGLFVYAREPKDLHIAVAGGTKWLLFTDSNNNGNDAPFTMSMVRALNLGLTTASIFNQTIVGGRVDVVAGNYSKGTGAWNQTTLDSSYRNTNGMAARDGRLFNPDGIAVDRNTGVMYVGLRNDHCIIRVTADGLMSQFINNCTTTSPSVAIDGPARDTNGNPIANVRYPGKIEMDPAYPESGNFFFTDFLDTASARVRYVNFLPQNVPFGNVNAQAGESSNPSITTIFTYPSAGMGGWTFGLAAFDRQICVSSGYWNGDSNNYAHNIQCKDRYNPNFSSNTSLVVGPDATVSNLRGGSPLGMEQEGVAASQAIMNGPTDLEFDDQGNLYIIEAGNHLIRFIRRWW